MRASARFATTIALITLGAAANADAAAGPWKPDAQTISQFEASIKLPDGFYNGPKPLLTEYARYYWGADYQGNRVVVGELVRADGNTAAGIYLGSDSKISPVIPDGGCTVVHLKYDVVTAKVTMLKCNGD
jgi:hypothetical protein